MVQTAVKLYLPQLRTASVQVHTDLAKDLPRVMGDSNQLLQVCLHITNNALHAMAETGRIAHREHPRELAGCFGLWSSPTMDRACKSRTGCSILFIRRGRWDRVRVWV